jgi:hypothetical protein
MNIEHIVCELAQAYLAKRIAYYALLPSTTEAETALADLAAHDAAFDVVTYAHAVAVNKRGDFLPIMREQIMNRSTAAQVTEILRPLVPDL